MASAEQNPWAEPERSQGGEYRNAEGQTPSQAAGEVAGAANSAARTVGSGISRGCVISPGPFCC